MRRSMLTMLLALAPATSALALGPTLAFGLHVNFTSSNFPGPSAGAGTAQVSSAYGSGWGGGVHGDLNLMVVSFRLSADYIHYSIDEGKFRDAFRPLFGNGADLISISGGGLGIYSVTASGKMPVLPLPVISPYLTGGIGLAWLNRDAVTPSVAGVQGTTIPSSSQAGKTTVNVGAGVDLKLGISLFLEVKYAWIFTEGSTSTYVPLSVGVTF